MWTWRFHGPEFLVAEPPFDGVVSGKTNQNPSKSSLIFITTLIQGYRTKILIDTGATTTFINKNIIHNIPFPVVISTEPYFCVLADGVAPFHVLGMIELSIQFDKTVTTIKAHIAETLCADMIIGMDYINLYNLSINVKQQTVSIEHNQRIFSMNIDRDLTSHRIPVVCSQIVHIPPHSRRMTSVSTPISSISSRFMPTYPLQTNSSLTIPHKQLNFHHYYSHVMCSNTSAIPQTIQKGTCLGFLLCSLGNLPSASSQVRIDKSLVSTASIGETPALINRSTNSVVFSRQQPSDNSTHPTAILPKTLCISSVCNTLPSSETRTSQEIQQLVVHLENKTQHDQMHSLLRRFYSTLDTTQHNIAKTPIHHVINTIPHSPPACRPYPQPDKEEPMYKLIQEFIAAGLITESHSPYAAPALLVRKQDNSFRFVVDYRRLNLITIKDSSPLPNMEETLRKLGHGYTYFSKLDLKSGFYQIPINQEDKLKTAFVTPFGLYQFNVLPMGLKNSPPTFQKVMTDTLSSCRPFCLVYLDDIIVFSHTFDEHLHHLDQVFTALQAKRLVLNPSKCEVAVKQIDYLGHTVSRDRMTPMKDKISAILSIDEPRSLAQANRFVGALGWYRKFLPNFATIAAPLHEVTNLTKNNRHKFRWKFAQSKAFRDLKDLLITEPLFLHYPVENKPLILTTDASGIGIGGVLQQDVDGKLRNLYYHSQLMTACERKYSVIEKEALAIYKCFERMRTILLGRSIIVMTDHCPLCHIMEKTVRNTRVDRISHLIQEYNIEKVVHIQGRENCLPDYLSRYSRDQDDALFDVEYGLESKANILPPEASPAPSLAPTNSALPLHNSSLLAAMTLRPRHKPHMGTIAKTAVDNDIFDNQTIDEEINQPVPNRGKISSTFSCNQFDIGKLKQEQSNDLKIQQIISTLNSSPNNLTFIVRDEILHKLITISRNSIRKKEVVYLPSSMILSLLQACHNDPMTGAHFATDRTYHKIKSQYWWPNMKGAIKHYIKNCSLCQQYNIGRHKKHGHLRPIQPPEGPFLLIGIDYCGPFKRTPRENQYVLVITDYFTRHVTALALPNCTAETTAQALFNEYFCKYGIPAVILSDQGSHFQNQLMENIQRLIGYNHIYSTPYHPQTNAIVERFNSTFVPQISKLQDEQSNNWDEYLQAVVFAYNTGVHRTTMYSPYELLYGRPARLPIDPQPSRFSLRKPSDYFEQLRKTLRIFHNSAKQRISLQQKSNKDRYDHNRLDPHYKVGDSVLTRIHGLRGKLDPKFSSTPHTVVHTQHPVYLLEDQKTNMRSQAHVNDLRPILID